MIHATYDRDGRTHTLSVNGHARYAKRGEDIVCAGVSAIVYSLVAWLENNVESEKFTSIDEQNGKVVISCEGDDNVAAVFYMAAIGIETISNTYPDHVDINIVGIAD